jgi:hypothetical protein
MKEKILVDEWLAVRTEAGKKIDPQAAEVMWTHAYTTDPYGVRADLLDEEKQIGREYFARSQGSEIWVSYGDLPDETLAALRGSPQEHRALEAQEAQEERSLDWLFEDAE